MNELSLFTGAGGGLLGTKLLGFRPVGYVDSEPYCQAVIAQRIRDGFLEEAPIFGDIREFVKSGAAREYRGFADVVTGGFPCQDISSAGGAPASMVNAPAYGSPCGMSFARFDPASSSWRTPQFSVFGGLDEYSATWPRWGLMRGGECFPLPMLEHDTSVRGSLSLPTVTASWARSGSGLSNNLDKLRMSEATTRFTLRLVQTLGWRWPAAFLEILMMWPVGWSRLTPLETAKFQAWCIAHGKSLPVDRIAECEAAR